MISSGPLVLPGIPKMTDLKYTKYQLLHKHCTVKHQQYLFTVKLMTDDQFAADFCCTTLLFSNKLHVYDYHHVVAKYHLLRNSATTYERHAIS